VRSLGGQFDVATPRDGGSPLQNRAVDALVRIGVEERELVKATAQL